jgi:hypothetical protein
MPSHNSRVSQALRLHRAVTRKISRIKAGNATEVSGSKYDPRQSPDWIRNATDAQLSALIRKHNKFLDRSVQFVPDANLNPLPQAKWKTFKALEAKKNQFVTDSYEPYKDIDITPAGQTVDSRMRAIAPLHAHMGERTTDNPYKKAEKASTSVYGESGLDALIKDMRKKTTKTHQRKSLQHHKDGVLQMARDIGDPELEHKISKLTAQQWLVLWKYTQFARNIKVPYQHFKDSMASRKGVTNSQMVANDLQVAHDYVDWASNLEIRRK